MAGFQEIVPGLYLGSGAVVERPRVLQLRGVTHILNVTSMLPCNHTSMFTYMQAKVEDDDRQDLSEVLEPTAQFIHEAVEGTGTAVFVHCQAGKSRSATIVLHYLVTRRGMTLRDAYEHVKERRRVIEPNLNFVKQLLDVEIRHHGAASIPFETLVTQQSVFRRGNLANEVVAQNLEKAKGNVQALLWILTGIVFHSSEPTQEEVDTYLEQLQEQKLRRERWREGPVIEVLERRVEEEVPESTVGRESSGDQQNAHK